MKVFCAWKWARSGNRARNSRGSRQHPKPSSKTKLRSRLRTHRLNPREDTLAVRRSAQRFATNVLRMRPKAARVAEFRRLETFFSVAVFSNEALVLGPLFRLSTSTFLKL